MISVFIPEDVEIQEHFIDAFLAYSAAGEVQGDLVYVNYGTIEDFELLADESNTDYYTNVTGKICIVRYGRVSIIK